MPWFSCSGLDVEACEFAFALFGINMQRHARDGIFIRLKNKIIAEAFLDHAPAALHEFIGFNGLFGEQLDRAHVLFLGGADLLVFVGVNERADAVVGKNLGEQAFVHLAVDDVDARHAGFAGGGGVLRLGQDFGRKPGAALLQQFLQFRHEHLPDEQVVVDQPVQRSDENQLGGLQSLGHGERYAVGIHPDMFCRRRRNRAAGWTGTTPCERSDCSNSVSTRSTLPVKR